MEMVTQEWVRNEIREALQEMVRAAEMRVTYDTDRIEDAASKAVEDCANAAIKEREAVWAASERACPGVEESPNRCGCGCTGCQHNCAAHQAPVGVCVCKPWTMVDGRGVYLQPGDNLAKVRGWDRTEGCPVHPIEGKPVCGAPSLHGNLTCSLSVHDVDVRHAGGGASWPNTDGKAEGGHVHQVLFGVPVQVNVKAFTELAGERPTRENVRELVADALKNSLVVDVIRLGRS